LLNLRELEGHDLPLSAEGLICFKTREPEKFVKFNICVAIQRGTLRGNAHVLTQPLVTFEAPFPSVENAM